VELETEALRLKACILYMKDREVIRVYGTYKPKKLKGEARAWLGRSHAAKCHFLWPEEMHGSASVMNAALV